jgi:hypothetical protein
LQACAATVEFQICTVMPGGETIIDCTPEGRVGSALIVKPGIQVLNKGMRGDGTFTWVEIPTITGPLKVGSVYAPVEQA